MAGQDQRSASVPADQPFQAFAVCGLDADAAVEAKTASVLPAEHVLDVVGLQEVVAAKMPEDPGADRELETVQELAGEGCGFVEAEGFGLHSRITA